MNTSTVHGKRQQLWSDLKKTAGNDGGGKQHEWDMIIVGGGITGAGILREAAQRGLNALLIEQQDFAWGTSSRSSKMVHGGLRYIAQGAIKLTRESLQERERLLVEAPGLVDRLGYNFTLRRGQFPGRFIFGILLTLYDALAGIRDHRYFNRKHIEEEYPGISSEGLNGACYYTDSITDDARLVLRVLQEAKQESGIAINYAKAENLIKVDGKVAGINLKDMASGECIELRAKCVVNATGAWADRLRNEVNPEKRIRPLRGSHLVLNREKLTLKNALTIVHPEDKRPIFIYPWEGATVVGTTDLDHREDLDTEASINSIELDYLLRGLAAVFPEHNINRTDIISTFSGVRPVIGSEQSKDPSKERRDHAVWYDDGLITVSGGKLTTFRLSAVEVVDAAIESLDIPSAKQSDDIVFNPPTVGVNELLTEDKVWARRLIGRYGNSAKALLNNAQSTEQQKIANTEFCLAECRWAVANESVVHLDDLLLRRTRLGSLLKNGGEILFEALQKICAEELLWDEERWQQELDRYKNIWNSYYYLPK